MSVISCDNSALVFPSSYPYGAIGSVIEPTINTVSVLSATLLQPIAAFTLPKGVWNVSGVISVDGITAGNTLTGNASIAIDAVTYWRVTNVTVQDGVSVVYSAVITSNGSNVITLPMTYTSSGGAGSSYAALASPNSRVQFTRIA